MEREAQCPHHVIFVKSHFLRAENYAEVHAWLESDVGTGTYVCSSVNSLYKYCFSDANTALQFKMRFA
jgi:hypothetical protein